MEEEIIVKKRYLIPYEMFGDAFTAFQKRFVYPRNNIMILILLVFAVLNVVNILQGNSSTFGYVLVLACIALAISNWYNPRKLKKNLMESIKGIENDLYEITLMPDKLEIGTVLEPVSNDDSKPKEEYEEVFDDVPAKEEIAKTQIFLTKDVFVLDKSEYFIIYLKRSMFYVVPKKDFSEEETTIMQIHFQKQLGKNYQKIEK